MGVVEGEGSYIYLDTTTICATPNEGYKFLRWNDGETDSLRKIVIKSDTVFTAIFAKEDAKIYTVSLTVNDENMGTVSGASDYIEGDVAIISATANTGYQFTNWSDGDTSSTREIIVTRDTALMANFKALPVPANYIVQHNQQALDGSYLTVMTDTIAGITDSLTTAVAKTFEGFTALAFEQAIIVNESVSPTVVSINYNRNSYKLTWNFDGGKATGNYTNGDVLFGTPIVAPAPTKDGYTFKAWKNLPETMPAHDVTCTATWTEKTTPERIRFTVPETFVSCDDRHIEATNITDPNTKFTWSVNGVVDETQTSASFDIPENAALTGTITVIGSVAGSSWEEQIQYTIRKSIITTMWNDVITVDNTTGNYESYNWYHNGELVSEKEYYQEIGGLTGEYYLKVITVDNVEINSCPETFAQPQATAITAYPNPTTDKVTVKSGNIKNGDKLIITDSNGRIWRTMTISNPAGEEFDLSNLPQGSYTITAGGESVNIIKL